LLQIMLHMCSKKFAEEDRAPCTVAIVPTELGGPSSRSIAKSLASPLTDEAVRDREVNDAV
ncbi:MAG: hypothetical protein M3274_00370, partial [Actinomycetota bacterium]|nr:hypothetical protein [Actinomycetota bacterium]